MPGPSPAVCRCSRSTWSSSATPTAGKVLDGLGACLAGHFDIEHSTFQLEPAATPATNTPPTPAPRPAPLPPRWLQVLGAGGCVLLVVTLPWMSVLAGLAVFAVGIAYRAAAAPSRFHLSGGRWLPWGLLVRPCPARPLPPERAVRGWVSYIRRTTIRPEAAVIAATVPIAAGIPKGRRSRRTAARRRRTRRRARAGRPRPSGPARRGGRRRRWRPAASGRPGRCRRRAAPRRPPRRGTCVPPRPRPGRRPAASIPATISGLRPSRSESAPVTSCPIPHTAGYSATRTPMLRQRQPGGGEQHREQAPGQAVVEVVDHPGLAGGRHGRFGEGGPGEHLPWRSARRAGRAAAVRPAAWRAASTRACSRVSRTSRLDTPRPRAA